MDQMIYITKLKVVNNLDHVSCFGIPAFSLSNRELVFVGADRGLRRGLISRGDCCEKVEKIGRLLLSFFQNFAKRRNV